MPRCLLLVFVALAVLAALGVSRSAAAPDDVTFAGSLSGGGTISITLTGDRSAVLRAELVGANFEGGPPGAPLLTLTVSTTQYFSPPRPVADGRFTLALLDPAVSVGHGSVTVTGAIADDTLSGGASYTACLPPNTCFDLAGSPWTASGPVETPPTTSDRRYAGTRADGRPITIALSSDGTHVRAVDLPGVSLERCLSSVAPISLRAFFDGDGAPFHSVAALVQTETQLIQVSITVEQPDETTLSGTLHVVAGLFLDDCSFDVAWTAYAFTAPTPIAPGVVTATPTPPPALPPSGSGPGESNAWVPFVALLAVAGAAAIAAGSQGKRRGQS